MRPGTAGQLGLEELRGSLPFVQHGERQHYLSATGQTSQSHLFVLQFNQQIFGVYLAARLGQ